MDPAAAGLPPAWQSISSGHSARIAPADDDAHCSLSTEHWGTGWVTEDLVIRRDAEADVVMSICVAIPSAWRMNELHTKALIGDNLGQ